MKKILFSLIVLIGLVYNSNAQTFAFGYRSDTLAYAGAADTVTVTFGTSSKLNTGATTDETIFKTPGVLEIGLRTDSLSGNPVASAYVEYSYLPTGNYWFRAASLSTINGAAAQFQTHTDTDCAAVRVRVVCIAAATTQSERVRVYWAFKKTNQ